MPEIHGHRGARALRPENTLPGLACALAIGVDALEFDVTLTADGGLVLAHDLVVDPATIRGPHTGSPWRTLTAAQIASLDAGFRTPPEPFADTFVPVPGTGVPTLDQVGRLITEARAGQVTLAVELKTDPSWPDGDIRALTAGALDSLGAHGLTGRARILAFNWRVLLTARELAPEVPRVALIDPLTWVPGSPWLAGLDPGQPDVAGSAAAAVAAGAAWLSPWDEICDARLIATAHALGLKVVAWTVNDPGRMAELISLGTDAIVTDRPDVLRALIAKAGGPVPAGCELPWPDGTPAWAPRVPRR